MFRSVYGCGKVDLQIGGIALFIFIFRNSEIRAAPLSREHAIRQLLPSFEGEER